jgi:thioredoxin 1
MSEVQKSKDNAAACGCGGGSCCSGRGKWIWVVLALAIAGVVITKNAGKKQGSASAAATTSPAVVGTTGTQGVSADAGQGQALPRLVDLGATKCIPCKMMAPILEDLKKTYAGKMDVQFIDVWENPEAGKKYGINVIPTQIFYDATGKELFRHEGFFGKDDILAKWKEFGVELSL